MIGITRDRRFWPIGLRDCGLVYTIEHRTLTTSVMVLKDYIRMVSGMPAQ